MDQQTHPTSYKIEITGIAAWGIFTFGAVSLLPVFVSMPFIRFWVLAVCSCLFILYFFAWYRSAFTVKKFIVLVIPFNLLIILLSWLYGALADLHPSDLGLQAAIRHSAVSLLVSALAYAVCSSVVKMRKQ